MLTIVASRTWTSGVVGSNLVAITLAARTHVGLDRTIQATGSLAARWTSGTQLRDYNASLSTYGGVDGNNRNSNKSKTNIGDDATLSPLSGRLSFNPIFKRAFSSQRAIQIAQMKLNQRRKSPKPIEMPKTATPKSLSNVMGLRSVDILKLLIKLGYRPESSEDVIPADLADLIATEFYFVPTRTVAGMKGFSSYKRTLNTELTHP